jgi:hypothetical protein
MQERLAAGQTPDTDEPPSMDELRPKRDDGAVVLRIDSENRQMMHGGRV